MSGAVKVYFNPILPAAFTADNLVMMRFMVAVPLGTPFVIVQLLFAVEAAIALEMMNGLFHPPPRF